MIKMRKVSPGKVWMISWRRYRQQESIDDKNQKNNVKIKSMDDKKEKIMSTAKVRMIKMRKTVSTGKHG